MKFEDMYKSEPTSINLGKGIPELYVIAAKYHCCGAHNMNMRDLSPKSDETAISISVPIFTKFEVLASRLYSDVCAEIHRKWTNFTHMAANKIEVA